jgi:nitroreductase
MKRLFKSVVALIAAFSTVGCCSEGCADAQLSKEEAVLETIMTRRSIRDYKAEPVSREQMAKVIECGIYAPSALNLQPWAVRVVDAPDFIEGVTAIAVEQNPELKDDLSFRNIFRNAPTVAFVACPEVSYSGEYDCGLLSENMMLAAWSMGIGSCCLGSVVPIMMSDEAKPYLDRLQLPEGYKLMAGIAFGYPEGDVPTAPERDASKAYYVE